MQISIRTPSRLHFGLIDLNGNLKRVDGGVGVAIANPCIDLTVKKVNDTELTIYPECSFVKDLIQRFYTKFLHEKTPSGLQVNLNSTIPPHVGLGSKTQLSLAIATCLSKIEQVNFSIRNLAHGMGRGGTSGIGIAAFDSGGFILDGGHKFGEKKEKTAFLPSRASKAYPPPVLIQRPLPEDWQFVIALPSIEKGAHGKKEVNIFHRYCPIPSKETERICRIVLMKLLPAVVEKDCTEFGEALNQLQTIGFKKVEIDLQPPLILDLMKLALEEGATGSGLSSFGPIVYALTDSEVVAGKISNVWEDKFGSGSKITGEVWKSTVQNVGAKLL